MFIVRDPETMGLHPDGELTPEELPSVAIERSHMARTGASRKRNAPEPFGC
jgi:hypothetical protein